MRISISKVSPTASELAEILEIEFAGSYSFKLFGLGEKSIMVRKSTFVGAQITVRENEIDIQSTAPSMATAYLLTFLEFLGLIAFVPFWIFSLRKQGRQLEKQLGRFFHIKYA